MTPRGQFLLAIGCGIVFTFNGLLWGFRSIRGDFGDVAISRIVLGGSVLMLLSGILWFVGAYRVRSRVSSRELGTNQDGPG